MNGDQTIRVALESDLEAIVTIYNQAVRDQRTADMDELLPSDRAAWLANHTSSRPVLVSELDGRVVGWISVSQYRPGRRALRYSAEVSYYVDYQMHGKGVGSAMMKYVLERCSEFDVKILFAILLENNLASIALLKKFGFRQWATLPNVAHFDDVTIGQVYYGLEITT